MLINWFTVAAQVVNFLVLVWLLRRFLYQPVLRALDEREKLIAAGLAGAAAEKALAQTIRDEFVRKNEEFDRERDSLLKKTVDDAEIERQRLLEAAREDAVALRGRQTEIRREDARALGLTIAARVRGEAFALAAKALADLAGTDLEERIVHVFIKRLPELLRDEAGKDFKNAAGPFVVRTSAALDASLRSGIETVLRKTLAPDALVGYEIVPGLLGGIEIATDGYKVAWSLGTYIGSLKQDIDELIKSQTLPSKTIGITPTPDNG